MWKKQNIQRTKRTLAVLDYMGRELKKEMISNEYSDLPVPIGKKINVPEIITPHPYSLYALCHNYEHCQRN